MEDKFKINKETKNFLAKGSIVYICKCFLGIIFAFITLYLIKICIFGNYIAEVLIARALPLSLVLVAISILFFAMRNKNKD